MPRRPKSHGAVPMPDMEEDVKPAVDFVESVLDLETGDSDEPKEFKSKNLNAERRRRERLNSNILALRSVVPNITKMSKESTLADAIDHIKNLQKEVFGLQSLLSDAPGDVQENQGSATSSETIAPPENIQCQSQGQVELIPLGSCKYHLRMFYTKKIGIFTKLVEALCRYNVQVTSLNTISFFGYAESVFSIEVNGEQEVVMVELRNLLSSIVQVPGN